MRCSADVALRPGNDGCWLSNNDLPLTGLVSPDFGPPKLCRYIVPLHRPGFLGKEDKNGEIAKLRYFLFSHATAVYLSVRT